MNHAIIVAAGNSTRMKGENKILADINGTPILGHTLMVFEGCQDISSITVVAKKALFSDVRKIRDSCRISKLESVIEGGLERQDSVFNGLGSLKNCKDKDIIVVHNGSNPMVKREEISKCIEEAREHGASVCAFPLKDTIKKVKGGFVENTLDRSGIWQIQTPQCVQFKIFKDAFSNAKKNKLRVTDDASLVEAFGEKVKIVPCSNQNFKITTPQDLEMARKMMGQKNGAATFVGLGQDSHRFSLKKKALVIGGHTIPNEPGLEANSDGDIILHALFNAISSAMGGRSLGISADEICKKGVTDSREYLVPLLDRMKKGNISIGNISISIEAKKPRLEQHHDAIKESLCRILAIHPSNIGLTFTTGEGLTSFGRGEGMGGLWIVTLRYR